MKSIESLPAERHSVTYQRHRRAVYLGSNMAFLVTFMVIGRDNRP